MRHLFYELVEMITEMITGIDSSAMSLWELPTYINTSQDVITWCNATIVLAIFLVVALGCIGVSELYNKHQRNG